MSKICPNLHCAFPQNIIRDGTFRRKDDSKIIQRFRCKNCRCRFSNATLSDTFGQKKRRINFPLMKLLSSNVSLRRSAILLGVDKKTVERKLIFLAQKCRHLSQKELEKLKGRVHNI